MRKFYVDIKVDDTTTIFEPFPTAYEAEGYARGVISGLLGEAPVRDFAAWRDQLHRAIDQKVIAFYYLLSQDEGELSCATLDNA